jgi:hypothetical protein
MDKALWLESVAQSNVDVIEKCLNTPPDEHLSEMAEELWFHEVGEYPAMYLSTSTEVSFFMSVSAWLYRRHPELIDGSTDG